MNLCEKENKMAKVAIVMGSDSDMPVMSKAADFLDQMGIDYEMTIISAHREPDIFFEWAKGAEERGVKVIIAGAGMAAHLPGMCAALFPMPVIVIPMKTSDLGGVDSLYSIVQMPSGIPVATVADRCTADEQDIQRGTRKRSACARQYLAFGPVGRISVHSRSVRLGQKHADEHSRLSGYPDLRDLLSGRAAGE